MEIAWGPTLAIYALIALLLAALVYYMRQR
jgi:hypothetical protein